MIKTLSLFPRKTAQPPLVGNTARTCTSMTVLFIRANRSRAEREKQAGPPFVIALVAEKRSTGILPVGTIGILPVATAPEQRARRPFAPQARCLCYASSTSTSASAITKSRDFRYAGLHVRGAD